VDEEELIARLAADLMATSGGYLRNTLRPSVLTCQVCDAPVSGYPTCYKCGHIYRYSPLAANQVASMIYAVRGRQSGFIMHGYKAALQPVKEHVLKVGSLLWIGISHRGCAGKLIGAPLTHWATVPSVPAKATQHPLNKLVARNAGLGYLGLPEINVVTAADARDPRTFRPENFAVNGRPNGAHVLLLDDTWVGGGHSQSAAAALKLAGATHVSLLNVARWLDPSSQPTASFLPDYFDARDFDPARCPWTGRSCPQTCAPPAEVLPGR
jgi:hypothetical protein